MIIYDFISDFNKRYKEKFGLSVNNSDLFITIAHNYLLYTRTLYRNEEGHIKNSKSFTSSSLTVLNFANLFFTESNGKYGINTKEHSLFSKFLYFMNICVNKDKLIDDRKKILNIMSEKDFVKSVQKLLKENKIKTVYHKESKIYEMIIEGKSFKTIEEYIISIN